MSDAWWFREVWPRWLTITYGQLAIGLPAAVIAFLVVALMDSATLQVCIAIIVAFKAFDEVIKLPRTKPKRDDEDNDE